MSLLWAAAFVLWSPLASATYATGFIWLMNGCSISTYLLEVTSMLIQELAPELCVYNAKELWIDYRIRHKFDGKYDEYKAPDGRMNLFEAVRDDKNNFKLCDPGQTPFVVAKTLTANVQHNETTNFDRRPEFTFATAIRRNIPEYLACLLRDQDLHNLHVNISDIGYLVDSHGARWDHQADDFRSDKDTTSAVLTTTDLPNLLSTVLADVILQRQALLHDAGVDDTVYTTEDLVDFSTPSNRYAAAGAWVSVLARTGIAVDIHDVDDILKRHSWSPPCDLRSRIYNLDDVRDTLRDTVWERFVYCPDELPMSTASR